MADIPHLVLNWTFDIPNHKLFIKIADDLEYEALEGGSLGYTKTYQGVQTHIDPVDWEQKEKFWISENYGEIYGYFQPDYDRRKPHPKFGWDQVCVNGFGPDGEYIDHMQRMQIILEGNDQAFVWGGHGKDMFTTPDKGKTIYKRVPTRDVNYPTELMADPNAFWPEWSQACIMQPRTKGYRLSSYDELRAAGAYKVIIDTCSRGEWDDAPNPELQQYYIYPTSQL
jgi:hypothetical protein